MLAPIVPPEIKQLYPFESHFINVNGYRLHYLDEGKGRNTVVLLHGNPTWSFLYRNFIPRLAKSCRVIAPDYLGFGLSEKPAEESAYSLDGHIANLIGLLDAIEAENVTVVMHDWGGPIGFGYTQARKEKAKGLVILNTWCHTGEPSEFHRSPFTWRILHAPVLGQLLLKRRNLLVERTIYLSVWHRERLTPTVLDAYRFPFPDYDSRTGVLAFTRTIPLRPGDRGWDTMVRLEAGLKDLDMPACILWGEGDVVFPPEFAMRFFKTLPKANEPVFFKKGRHFIQEDHPEEITDAILQLIREVS